MKRIRLTDKQWKAIEKRLSSGEKAIDLANEFEITRGAISKKFSQQQKAIKTLANQIVETEVCIQSSTISIQIGAYNLAQELLSVSKHMATGANNSAMNYSRLSRIATKQLAKISEEMPTEDELALVRTLTIMSNEAAKTPLDLIKSSQAAGATEPEKENSFLEWRKELGGSVIGIVSSDN